MPKTKYIWDEDNILYETDGNDAVTAQYTYSPEQYGNLISEHRDGTTYTHYYDAQGSTVAMTDDTGHVTDTFVYNAWGEEVARTGTTGTQYRWNGNTGYYNKSQPFRFDVRRRQYDSMIGRWLSYDPLVGLKSQNRFCYGINSPVVMIDPAGLKAWCAGLQAGVGGFITHPSITLKQCWDDCGNLTVAATFVSAPPALAQGQEDAPLVISTNIGLTGQLNFEAAPRSKTCVADMAGIFFELHVSAGEGGFVELGIEVTPDLEHPVLQGGIGIGASLFPIGAILERTNTYMAKCTNRPCPCSKSWCNPCHYLLGPVQEGACYLGRAQINCGVELALKLKNWAAQFFGG